MSEYVEIASSLKNLEAGKSLDIQIKDLEVTVDHADSGKSETVAATFMNIGYELRVNVMPFHSAMQRLTKVTNRISRILTGDAGKAGYRIENRRGRNRLVAMDRTNIERHVRKE